MYILINFLYIIAGYLWGDWKNWKKYYPTILFFIIGDFLYNFILYNDSMWVFHDAILPNHTFITILSMFVSYSATVLIYLGRFPQGWKKRFLWFLLWSGIYIIIEFINNILGFITYHNGWNFVWSCLFTGVIFVILPIHHKRPLLAWSLSIVVILSLFVIFDIKITNMK
ncbi:CBO0543 family protein [Gracilibacillus massiliensis]|uniref:CBO0543 family protein n=1 Tax=Gracilibacillus massiliensis TaxID=1564956 RepID=UPI00071CCAF1|nr:CBO0543 family protein [Gracilibacillus massiliensis]